MIHQFFLSCGVPLQRRLKSRGGKRCRDGGREGDQKGGREAGRKKYREGEERATYNPHFDPFASMGYDR